MKPAEEACLGKFVENQEISGKSGLLKMPPVSELCKKLELLEARVRYMLGLNTCFPETASSLRKRHSGIRPDGWVFGLALQLVAGKRLCHSFQLMHSNPSHEL